MSLDGSIIDEAWNKEWNEARKVAQSIIEKWNTSDSPALYVMIADALMNARAEGWQSAFDAWIGSDAQNATALRAENAELQRRIAHLQSLYDQAAQTIRNQNETIRDHARQKGRTNPLERARAALDGAK